MLIVIFSSSNLQILCYFTRRFNIQMAMSPLIVKIIFFFFFFFFFVGVHFLVRSQGIIWYMFHFDPVIFFHFFVSCYDNLSGWGNLIFLA